LIAVTYATVDPEADIHALLRYMRDNGASIGIDANRIGIWACSGNVPNALSVLMREPRDHFKCAVLCYGFMLDLDGSTGVADAAKAFGFVNPGAGKSAEDLPGDLPLFIVRAGQDVAALNETIDRFVAKTVARNLPLTLKNLPNAPHSFDVLDDSDTSRETIRQILAFMRFHLASR
jgi:acetyl esterase/lipase